jgi:hypothetical protein
MANEQTTGAQRADERRALEAREGRVGRKEAEDRDAALRHAERPRRRPGRTHATWPVLLGGLVLFAVGTLVAKLLRR